MSLEIIVISFLAFLTTKELAGAMDSKRAQRLSNFLIGPITGLLILFIILSVSRVIEILLE